jgi:cellulose synthase/poly-beta-1,6-N-acetylglucosamine synthase-like glycosyltransferase
MFFALGLWPLFSIKKPKLLPLVLGHLLLLKLCLSSFGLSPLKRNMEPKSDQPFLSIIIPVYNQNPELLERALKSAVSQKEAPDYEVIVVDDGSTQTAKTAELCLKYNARFLPLEHQGLSGARDSGILAANGMYISFLDSDDYLSDQFVNFCSASLFSSEI